MLRQDWKPTLAVGCGFLSISLIWPIFNQFIPIFLQAGNPVWEKGLLEAGRELPDVVGFGLAPSLAFFIMTWDNIINMFVQPWAGAKSDTTWNRFGRRKPWVLVGVPIAALAFIFVPLAKTVLAIMVFTLVTNLGMALFRSPTVAWLGDLFPSEQRSKANGVLNLMGGVGAAVALFGGGVLFDQLGRVAPFTSGAVLMVVMATVAVLYVKEPQRVEEDDESFGRGVLENFHNVWQAKDRSGFYILLGILLWFMAFTAIEAGLSSFAVFTLGMTPGRASVFTTIVAVSFILSAVPSGLIATRIGRRDTINTGLVAFVVLLGGGYLLIQGPASYAVLLVLSGVCWALININSLPLVYDVGDEGRIGAYTGLYYFASQSAAVLGPVLVGYAVEFFESYRIIFAFGAVFMALAWLAMQRVTVGMVPSVQASD